LRSAKRGLTFTALPAEGYDGEVPPYPLPRVSVFDVWFSGGERHKVLDLEATDDRHERELELWAQAWRTPQAAMWACEGWRWHTVALWVRTSALCESGGATAADKNSLHRFADQVGLTPAGLKENGWKICVAETMPTRVPPPSRTTARDRIKALRGVIGTEPETS
jgi:hypothetical protein